MSERTSPKRRTAHPKRARPAEATDGAKGALEALSAGQVSLEEVQRVAHLGSWDWNIAEGSLAWSDEIYRIFGLEPQEFGATYEAFLGYVHPDDRGLVQNGVDAAIAGKKPYSVRHRVVRPDGEERVVHERGDVTFGDGGQPVRMLGTVQDVTEQTRLQEELARSQAYNRGLIEASADGLITVDARGRITDVNEQMCRLTGCSREALVGSAFASYFADPRRARAGVRKTFEKGVVNDYVLVLKAPDGERTVSFNAAVYRGENDEVAGIFASARDITEQTRLQEELARSQAYNRGLIEASADGLVTIDHDGVITDVNEQMCRMTGHRRGELIGSDFASHCLDHARARRGVELTFQNGSVSDYVLTLAHGRAEGRAFSFNATLYRGEQGEVAGIFASARDITEQKRLETEMRNAQLYTRSLIEASLDALMTTDKNGLITDVNAEMEALTGCSRDELIGTRFRHHATDPDRAAAGIEQVVRDGAVRDYELTIRAKDGRETDVSFNATTFLDQRGELRGIFADARDVTERKRLEEEKYISRFFDLALDLLCVANVEGYFERVSPAFEQQLGWAPEEMCGQPILNFVHPDDRDATQAVLNEHKLGAPAINLENRYLCKDGSYRWLLWRAAPPTETGLLYATARDITEWKQHDEELKALAEQREEALLRTQALQRVSAGLTAAVTPEQVLQVVFDEALLALGADSGALGLLSDDRKTIESKRIGIPQEIVERYAVTSIEEELPQNACVRDGIEFWCASLEDLRAEYPHVAELLSESGYSALACLPLKVEGETIGYLAARFYEQQTFSANDRAFARTVAEQCSQAVARARLYEQRESALAGTRVLQRVSAGLTRATTLEEVGRVIYEEAFPLLGVKTGSVGVLDEERKRFRVTMGGWAAQVVERYESIPLDADLPAAACVRDNRARWYRSRAELGGDFAELQGAIDDAGLEAAFVLPLATKEEAIGFLTGFFSEPRSFEESDRRFIETVAEQCTQALSRARLHEERAERAEAALVLDRVGDGIFRLDEAGRIRTWNPAAQRLVGVSAADALGMRAEEILAGWDEVSKELELALPGEAARRRSLPFTVEDRELWLSISGVQLASGAVYAFHDVTSERELERRQRNFVATVSHELRTPLTGVYGAVRTLERPEGELDEPTRRALIKTAIEQGERLRRLTEEILAASEVDDIGVRLQETAVDPVAIAGTAVTAARALLSPHHTLKLVAPESLPSFQSDPDRLLQVLGNLIDNAIKFSPDGGEVTVAVESTERAVVFIVADQGLGIPAAERERVFERFYRLDPTQTRGIGGTGLGLYICHELVDRLGGKITVRSSEGEGSSFRVELPANG